MSRMTFGAAIDRALDRAMTGDERIIILGEDVHMLRASLYARFGPNRVLPAPISESAFLAAAAGAAMSGLRPVVEVMLVDFIAVAMDALLNHAAKLETFSGGRWHCPLVIRSSCGGGYGDGGQHEQALWGMIAGIPGLKVVVPSTPGDACGLMLSAIDDPGPVVYLEHKLLSEGWLESMGSGGREHVQFDVPSAGAEGEVDLSSAPVPIGKAVLRRQGDDLTIVSLAVGVHRALEAADYLAERGIECSVIDLRSVCPLDKETVIEAVGRSDRLLVVDEDYREFGLSGELAALVMEAGLHPRFARVCLDGTIPYASHLEKAALPNVDRIIEAAENCCA